MVGRKRCKYFKVGDYLYNNEGYKFQVIEYEDAHNVTIRWEDGQTDVGSSGNIASGRIRYFNSRETYGIGFLGYGKYVVGQKRLREGQKHINPLVYQKWRQMLERCYTFQVGHPYYEVYKDCFVNEKWHNFQNFSEWMMNNRYAFNRDTNNRPWCLDKDILFPRNREYSEDRCLFVPNCINSFFSRKDVGNTGKMGVNLIKPRFKNAKIGYIARCNDGYERRYLGYYDDPDEAEDQYFKCKDAAARTLADKWKGIVDDSAIDRLYSLDSRKWFVK